MSTDRRQQAFGKVEEDHLDRYHQRVADLEDTIEKGTVRAQNAWNADGGIEGGGNRDKKSGIAADDLLMEDFDDDFSMPTDNAPTHILSAPVIQRESFRGYESSLLKVVFGKPRQWTNEWSTGLELAEDEQTPGKYGMWQEHGGPCGVVAPVQGFLLLHLLEKKIKPTECTHQQAVEALRAAFGHILFHIAPSARVCTGTEVLTYPSLSSFLESEEPFRAFTRPRGIINFLYSCLLTRGLDNFRADGDCPEDSRAIGGHNYCTQEFVNLVLSGRGCSNVFDGVVQADGMDLKGLAARQRIGLLTLFEHYGNIAVGEHLKNPLFPIWIVHAESHYSIMFAEQESTDKEYIYYDPLGRFDEEKRLTISVDALKVPYDSDDLDNNGMIDKVLRTKFGELAEIDWNGTERIL